MAAKLNSQTVIPGVPGWGYVSCLAIPTYLCPSDPLAVGPMGVGMSSTTNGPATDWAFTNYAGNYNVFGNVFTPDLQGETTFAMITDGTSNTIFFAERYGTCGNSGNVNAATTFSPLWGDASNSWRPSFCVNLTDQTPTAVGYTACEIFQVMPNAISGCNSNQAQTPHAAIMVGAGDGSVRSVASSISANTWANACNPADGNPPGSDW